MNQSDKTFFMYTIYTNITYFIWFLMGIVWFIGSFGNKKTIGLPNKPEQIFANILLLVGVYLLYHQKSTPIINLTTQNVNNFVSLIGVALCTLGALFAIWARLSLGRNWSGAVITLKEDHKLIEHGPYKYVRHPIYTGFIFAALGVALTVGSISAYMGTILFLIAFLIRIQKEETLMTHQFPSEYPAYKKNSKKLIPFIW